MPARCCVHAPLPPHACRTWALSAQQPDSALEFKVSEVKRVWQVASHCSLAWATIDGFVDDFRTAYM